MCMALMQTDMISRICLAMVELTLELDMNEESIIHSDSRGVRSRRLAREQQSSCFALIDDEDTTNGWGEFHPVSAKIA